jgi:hypothetical protein
MIGTVRATADTTKRNPPNGFAQTCESRSMTPITFEAIQREMGLAMDALDYFELADLEQGEPETQAIPDQMKAEDSPSVGDEVV